MKKRRCGIRWIDEKRWICYFLDEDGTNIKGACSNTNMERTEGPPPERDELCTFKDFLFVKTFGKMKPHRREGSYWVTLDHFLISQEFLQSHQIGHAFRKFRSEKQRLDHFFTLFWKVDKNHTTLEKTYWRKRFWVSRISVSPLRLWHLFQKSHQMIVLKIDLLSGISILFFLYENRKKFETVEFRSRKLSSFQKNHQKLSLFGSFPNSRLITDTRNDDFV